MNSKALALLARVRKEYGERAISVASEMATAGRLTSGSLALDVVLGGGWPTNSWHEIIGKESHGKTTIVYKTVAANQALNPDFTVLWVAAEDYNGDRATELGVDNDRVILSRIQAMEEAYDVIVSAVADRAVDLWVLDSYPALLSAEEENKGMDEAVVAMGARLTGKLFRKLGSALNRVPDDGDRPITGIFVNQWRDAIGAYSPRGIPKTTPGGNAKNYAFNVRLEVTRDEFIDEPRPGKGKVRVGQVIKVKTIKNKSAPPQRVGSIDFYFADAPYLGFRRGEYDLVKEYLTYGIYFDIIERRGAYFLYGDRKWQGKDALLASLREELDFQQELRHRILFEAARPDSERLRDESAS